MILIRKLFYPGLLIVLCLLFFYQTLFRGLLPIPADTIIGLYHPFRDLYADEYPNGIPYKNFLITDPVRQQYPWKKLAIEAQKRLELPTWNPYTMSGAPLLSNFQSSAFYPLNIFLLILPFKIGWSVLVFSQIALGGIFMYFYLLNQRLRKEPSLLGAIVFSFSGFSIAWLEWGTVLSTALWAPLILLAIDKTLVKKRIWSIVLILALCASFFGGHLQIFFYSVIVYLGYLLISVNKNKISRQSVKYLIFSAVTFLILSLPQALPTLRFLSLSARLVDLNWHAEGWFIPHTHLVQFLIPDFFGNPATLNYFGVWNYAELVGYVGIVPLILGIYAFSKKNVKILFFWIAIAVSFLFALPNPIAQVPFVLNIPFLSTAQPTRLLFVVDLSLAVLSAYGFQKLLENKDKSKQLYLSIAFVFAAFIFVVLLLFIFPNLTHLSLENLQVSKRNIYVPAGTFILSVVLLIGTKLTTNLRIRTIFILAVLILVTADLFRFGWKFTPFTKSEYLYPNEKILTYLQNQSDKNFRIMSDNSEILPPNFSSVYHLQSVEGYDPLYLLRYGELISAMERGRPDISVPFGFNRLVTPHNYSSPIFPLLGVKYLLSFSDIQDPNFKLIMTDKKTNLYENKNVLPRAFFISRIIPVSTKGDAIKAIYDTNFDPRSNAVVENSDFKNLDYAVGSLSIVSYNENKINIETKNDADGFLVLLDSNYPTWEAKIDGKPTKIYRTDFNFRGIRVDRGIHKIVFEDKLL